MDAMTDAQVWKDDALVFFNKTEKWYSKASPGARIKVEVPGDL
jgi:Holliday junction resolvase RusA-like endonuclease